METLVRFLPLACSSNLTPRAFPYVKYYTT
nr:MAG TPA: hypothetical protein [Caudoviricetes sp.]